jgi:hypothetical protein
MFMKQQYYLSLSLPVVDDSFQYKTTRELDVDSENSHEYSGRPLLIETGIATLQSPIQRGPLL